MYTSFAEVFKDMYKRRGKKKQERHTCIIETVKVQEKVLMHINKDLAQ